MVAAIAATTAAIIAATIGASALCLLLFPARALASDTVCRATYDQVRISALVEPDGDPHVRERFTVSYAGAFHGMYWVFDEEPQDLSAGEYVDGEFVPYELADVGTIDPGTYTLLKPPKKPWLRRIDLHVDKADETAEYLLEYRLPGKARRWADVGTLDWEPVGKDWDDTLHHVTIDIYVARPEDSGTWQGENVFAWMCDYVYTTEVKDVEDAMAPPELTGGDAEVPAAHVRCALDEVEEGHDVDVSVLFPSDWLFERDAWDEPKRAEVMKGRAQDVEVTAIRRTEKSSAADLVAGVAHLLVFGVLFAPFVMLTRGHAEGGRHGGGRSSGGGSGGGSSGGGGGHGGGSY